MNETTNVGVSLTGFCDFLCNMYISVDGLIEVLVLSARAYKVNDDIGVLNSFIVQTVVIEVEVAHDIALATACA